MEESTKIILGAIISATILLLGAIIKYAFSRKSEQLKKKEELCVQAYVDFTRGVSGIAIAQGNSGNNEEYLTLLTDAKTRISIYGSVEVINAIADFWRLGPIFDTPERMKSYVNVIQLMRKENLKSEILQNLTINNHIKNWKLDIGNPFSLLFLFSSTYRYKK